MGCNCKDNREEINKGLKYFEELKRLFIKRMTEDSETQDRCRKDFNQAIFFYDDYSDEFTTCFTDTTMKMVLDKFDQAVKDWRKSWCDVVRCTRK